MHMQRAQHYGSSNVAAMAPLGLQGFLVLYQGSQLRVVGLARWLQDHQRN